MEITKHKFSCERDNLTIRGVEFRPKGTNLPIFVVCHGFTSNHKIMIDYARLAAKLGYAAYCFDFCGGSLLLGESDGETTNMSVLTEVEDLKAVIDYVKSLEYTDDSQLVLMGHSQGGLVSSLVAHDVGAKKLCLLAPAFCLPGDARKGDMLDAKFDPEIVPETLNCGLCGLMKIGKKYVSDIIEMDAYAHLDKYTGDVLIICGELDERVPFATVKVAFEKYKSRTIGKTYIKTIKDAGHRFLDKNSRIEALKLLGVFIKKS